MVVTTAATVSGFRREKFICWEFNPLEKLARIIGCGDTFFFGNAEVVGRNEHLYIAHNLDNGEQSDCHIHSTRLHAGIKVSSIPTANAFRDPATGFGMARAVAQACGKTNGFGNLYGGFWEYLADSSHVSYTHLDVYKRQLLLLVPAQKDRLPEILCGRVATKM